MEKKEFAKETIKTLKANGVNWPCLVNTSKFIDKVERQLAAQQETNLYDFEDIANMIMFEVVQKNTILSLGKMIKKILQDYGNIKKPSSPKWQILPNQSSDDDGTGAEDVDHDMGTVCGPDIGAGSDAHIAILDVGSVFGADDADILECSLAGCGIEDTCTTRDEKAPQHDHTENKVKKSRAKVLEWLKVKGYTLDTSNRKLGVKRSSEDIRVSFNASRKQSKRDWELPEVDHRGTLYVQRAETDYTESFGREHEHNEIQCEGWFGTNITSKTIAKAVTGTPFCIVEGTGQLASELMKRYGHRSETWVSVGYTSDMRSQNHDCFRKSLEK